jgi:hypothetical protein
MLGTIRQHEGLSKKEYNVTTKNRKQVLRRNGIAWEHQTARLLLEKDQRTHQRTVRKILPTAEVVRVGRRSQWRNVGRNDGCDQVFRTYPKEERQKERLKVDMEVKTMKVRKSGPVSRESIKEWRRLTKVKDKYNE